MLTKDNVIKTISMFPDNFTLDELVDRLIFMDKVEKGLEQSLANSTYILTDEQHLAIEEAQKQFKNGQFLKSDKADLEIDEWLGK